MNQTRIVGDRVEVKLYAYRHRQDVDRFGVTSASDYEAARRKVGRVCDVRAIWLDANESKCATYDSEKIRSIVDEAFAGDKTLEKVACCTCRKEFMPTPTQARSASGGGRVYCCRKCQIAYAATWSIRPKSRSER